MRVRQKTIATLSLLRRPPGRRQPPLSSECRSWQRVALCRCPRPTSTTWAANTVHDVSRVSKPLCRRHGLIRSRRCVWFMHVPQQEARRPCAKFPAQHGGGVAAAQRRRPHPCARDRSGISGRARASASLRQAAAVCTTALGSVLAWRRRLKPMVPSCVNAGIHRFRSFGLQSLQGKATASIYCRSCQVIRFAHPYVQGRQLSDRTTTHQAQPIGNGKIHGFAAVEAKAEPTVVSPRECYDKVARLLHDLRTYRCPQHACTRAEILVSRAKRRLTQRRTTTHQQTPHNRIAACAAEHLVHGGSMSRQKTTTHPNPP